MTSLCETKCTYCRYSFELVQVYIVVYYVYLDPFFGCKLSPLWAFVHTNFSVTSQEAKKLAFFSQMQPTGTFSDVEDLLNRTIIHNLINVPVRSKSVFNISSCLLICLTVLYAYDVHY